MIRLLIDLYIFILIADIILSYLPQLRDNHYRKQINKLAELSCAPIRKILPKNQSFDFSAVAVIFLLNLVKILW